MNASKMDVPYVTVWYRMVMYAKSANRYGLYNVDIQVPWNGYQ